MMCLVEYSKNYTEKEQKSWIVDFLENEYKKINKFATHWFEYYFGFSKDIPVIPVVISSEKPPLQKYSSFSGREMAKIIVLFLDKYYHNCETEERIKLVEKLNNSIPFSEPICGCYHSNGYRNDYGRKDCFELEYVSRNEREEINEKAKRTKPKPYIEIFLKNFTYKNENELMVQLTNCLAHEYLHFIHNWIIGSGFSKKGKVSFKENAVKEALADYFALVFTIRRHSRDDVQLAQERFNLWVKRFGTTWPYAYALCIFYNNDEKPVPFSEYESDYTNNDCMKKFARVLDESKKNMQDAFEALL